MRGLTAHYELPYPKSSSWWECVTKNPARCKPPSILERLEDSLLLLTCNLGSSFEFNGTFEKVNLALIFHKSSFKTHFQNAMGIKHKNNTGFFFCFFYWLTVEADLYKWPLSILGLETMCIDAFEGSGWWCSR